MEQFFHMFVNLITSIWGVLGTVSFTVNGLPVTLSAILFAFLVVGIVINVFWKGAKT